MTPGTESMGPLPVRCPGCQAQVMAPADSPLSTACPFCRHSLFGADALDHHVVPQQAKRSANELSRLHANAHRQSMQSRDEEARERKTYRQQVRTELEANGELPSHVELVILPAIDRPITPLADDRKRKFLRYITQVAEQALFELEDSQSSGKDAPSESADLPVVDVRLEACSLCRGSCCLNGGEHGYLLAASLQRWLEHDDLATVEEIVALYESFLPNATYADSCVFHTDRGCTIPQEYRSNTCNAFICQGLAEFETRADASLRDVMLAASRNGQMIRRQMVHIRSNNAE